MKTHLWLLIKSASEVLLMSANNSVELPHRAASNEYNEYPHPVFSWRNNKKYAYPYVVNQWLLCLVSASYLAK